MFEQDCQRCKSWKGCPGKDWYGFHEIHWCVQQVFWLLKFADTLRAGQWVTPDATADLSVRGKGISTEASFTKAVLVIAELDYRLKKTGWKGKLLAEEAKNREKMMYLSDDAKDALYYVAGWKRKDRNFSEWLKDRRYHQKSDKVIAQVGVDK
jgi:hypothetical protein